MTYFEPGTLKPNFGTANWDTWRFMPRVRLYEAAALTLNVEPTRDVLLLRDRPQLSGPHVAQAEEVQRRMGILAANVRPEGPIVGSYGDWEEEVSLAEVGAWASAACGPGWTLPEAFPNFKRQPPAESSAATKERNTMLKLILGMAVDAYGFDPRAPKSDAPRRISGDLATKGFEISEDTVRKYLRAAAHQSPASS